MMMTGFNPAISRDALTKIGAQVRSWGLHRRPDLSAADLARWVNPVVRGWMNYYGAFYRSALYPLLARINAYLMRWLRNKYKRLRGRKWRSGPGPRPSRRGHGTSPTGPGYLPFPPSGDQDNKSRITGDCAPFHSALDRPFRGSRFGRR